MRTPRDAPAQREWQHDLDVDGFTKLLHQWQWSLLRLSSRTFAKEYRDKATKKGSKKGGKAALTKTPARGRGKAAAAADDDEDDEEDGDADDEGKDKDGKDPSSRALALSIQLLRSIVVLTPSCGEELRPFPRRCGNEMSHNWDDVLVATEEEELKKRRMAAGATEASGQPAAATAAAPAAASVAAKAKHCKGAAAAAAVAAATDAAASVKPAKPTLAPRPSIAYPRPALVRCRLVSCYGPLDTEAIRSQTAVKAAEIQGWRREDEEDVENKWKNSLLHLLGALACAGVEGASLVRASLLGQKGDGSTRPVHPGFEGGNRWFRLHSSVTPFRAAWSRGVGQMLSGVARLAPSNIAPQTCNS